MFAKVSSKFGGNLRFSLAICLFYLSMTELSVLNVIFLMKKLCIKVHNIRRCKNLISDQNVYQHNVTQASIYLETGP